MEIAVEHHGTCLPGGIEWLLSVKFKVTMQIDPIARKGIVGTLHVTMVEEDAARTVERVHVEPADEPDVTGHHPVAMAVGHMRLRDGRGAFLSALLRSERIVEVHITIVAHSEVAHLESVAMEVEHGEIAHRPLRLSTLRGEHHMAWVVGESDDVEILAIHGHAKRLASVASHGNGWVVGVVYPIDVGSHIYHHGFVGCSIMPSPCRLLERAAGKRSQRVGEGGVDEQMTLIEQVGFSVEGE